MAVTATFATGSPLQQCVVPNVKGKKLRAATAAIKRSHCSVGKITEVKSPKNEGKVISQSPKPGKQAPGERPEGGAEGRKVVPLRRG